MIKAQIWHKFSNFELDLKLEFPTGINVLFGKSGAGKSLTLKALSGIWTPDKGKIDLNNNYLLHTEKKINLPPQKRQTGFLFQNHNLFPHFTLLENLLYGLPHASFQERKEKAQQLIEKFHLTELQNNFPHQLSGGQIQRAALARALMREPQFLLLDEPFSSLDHPTKNELSLCLQKVLGKLKIPVILVTHDPYLAKQMAQNIIFIEDGKISENTITI